ncbi:MAG: asparagine synthase (glutamine-hydrolyzing) [Deltaproteobacteria bacterium]|nr:asparagine synthase (glutamine-hydrolyzing) [Deltaproteobacteria bacterium]MBW2137251.1 asparagine synthase (glutamine-hydrolyzing) [Deltaproteobacteria bacterium]
MCGICGKLDLGNKPIDESLLRRMCRSFAHRGPDDEGTIVRPPVGLGHRRLSIIDLSPAGHQPMCNEDGTVWLVFNGEIYDYKNLRKDLLSRGHRLKSQTDCEVILHLYEEEGIRCLAHLNGMFAFALWDGTKEKLYLGRDRLGIKPLHFFWDGKKLLFASEIKAMLCDPEIPRKIDQEALHLYLTLNYIPAPWTIFKGIRKLLPASYLLFEKDSISTEIYWDIPAFGTMRESEQEDLSSRSLERHKERLWSLLEASVRRRLISDVPLGAFLSGGIDSSIIVALMARNSSRPVKTFSIGYRDLPSFDETKYAREVAALNSTDHHEFRLGYRDILDAFPMVLENIDEPFADSSAVPTYIVSRETRNHVTVALSGDGGDELFAGYRMYLGEFWSRYYGRVPGLIRNKVIEPLVNALPDSRDNPCLEKVRRAKKFLRGMSHSFPERFYGWREVFPYPLQQRLLTAPPDNNVYLGAVRRMVENERPRFGDDTLNLMLYMDLKGLLPNDMLTKVDRMSMANSLEVRVPLLDHSFVEYVFRLKGDLKLRGRRGKFLFIDTFKELLPRSLHKRPKWGFEMPVGAWLRKELRFLIDEYLSEASVRQQGLFNFEVIRELITNHMSGRQDTSWHLWNLIVFQHWYRKYLA